MRRAIAVASFGLVVLSMASARAMFSSSTPPATTSSANCSVSSAVGRLPGIDGSYRAGSAGRVAGASQPDGGISVSSVTPAAGFRPIVDKALGTTVEVYFGARHSQVDFTAEAGATTLEVRVTTCR